MSLLNDDLLAANALSSTGCCLILEQIICPGSSNASSDQVRLLLIALGANNHRKHFYYLKYMQKHSLLQSILNPWKFLQDCWTSVILAAMINSRERVFAALRREVSDRVPIGEIGGGYAEEIIQAILGEDYRDGPDDYFLNHLNIRNRLGADLAGARVYGPESEIVDVHEEWGTDLFTDFWGATYTQPPNATVQLVTAIAETPEALDDWQPPDVRNFSTDLITRWKTDTELFMLTILNAGFDLGYELLGFERFMMWTIQAPETMRRYYEKLINTNAIMAEMAMDAGTDGILIADDLAFNSGTFVDPSYLRSEYFPFLKPLVQRIKSRAVPVFFHSDGDLRAIIPDLIDCGIDVLQSCDPNANMNIPELQSKYGHQLAFMGNIDVDLLAHGNTHEVEESTRKLIQAAGPKSGFILSAANVVAKYCKPANVLSMYKTAHEETLT